MGNAEPVSIADEVLFEIQESWEWVRLQTVCTKLVDGDHNPPKGEVNRTDYIMASSTNINQDRLVDLEKVRYLSAETFLKENERTSATIGDIFFTSVGSLGRSCIFDGSLNICFQRSVSVITTLLFNEYLKYCFDSGYFQNKVQKEATGTAQKGFYLNQLESTLIPVPPYKEQARIVLEIKKYLPLISEYEKQQTSLNELNNNFSDQLKKSILQMAVQGKLVPQDPSDEPASVLLERIRAEKERLIREGKIKRDKNESVIYRRDNSHYEKLGSQERCIDDEIPFDIPDTWEWCRMSSILNINPRNQLPDNTTVGFMPMPLLEDGFNNRHAFEERKWKTVKSGFTHFKNDDVVVAKITPCFQNRKSAVIRDLPNGYGAGTTELHVLRDMTNTLYMPYILLICKTHAFIAGGISAFTGTAGQQRVGKEYIANYLIPLPPIQEQIRIANSVQIILESLDELL